MGKWSKGFMSGVDTLIKAKIDVKGSMKNLNAFVQAIDSCEDLDGELYDLDKEIDKLTKELEKKQKEFDDKVKTFEKQADAVAKNVPTYDNALRQFEKAAKTTGSKEIEYGCDGIRNGLRQVEGLTKLSNKTYMKKK